MLVKMVLTAMPAYTLQTMWILDQIYNKMDKISRNFLWKNDDGKGINLVARDIVTKPKMEGDLSICSARKANVALLGKLIWNVIQSVNKPWVQLLRKKYLRDGNIFDHLHHVGAPYTWKAILKATSILNNRFIVKLRNKEASIWYDKWILNTNLC